MDNETHDTLKKEVEDIITEVNSSTTLNDVDKFHRVGPKKGNTQNIIVRFTSHTAKENFFLRRKQIKRRGVKIQPSLAPGRRELLEEATEFIKEFETHDYDVRNKPHFVFADTHGNLKLKMTMPVNGRMFFNFSSIVELSKLIEKNQDHHA